jgi:hypothetical protein
MSQTQETTVESNNRINPSNEATFRALKNLSSKIVQCEHHIQLLEDHRMKGTTPKGLTSTIYPNLPFTDIELIIQWEKIKLDFQSKLLVSLTEFWNRYKSRLSKDQTKLEKNLKANSTEEEWNNMTTILQKVQEAAKARFNNKKNQNTNQRRKPENSLEDRPGEENRRVLRRRGNRDQTQN